MKKVKRTFKNNLIAKKNMNASMANLKLLNHLLRGASALLGDLMGQDVFTV